MHPLLDVVRPSGSEAVARQAKEYATAMNLEDDFVHAVADKVFAVIISRLREGRGTFMAAINDAPSLQVKGVTINTWAKWRNMGQGPTTAFDAIELKATSLIARRLHLEPSQVTASVSVGRMNEINRIVFHFAEPITQVPMG